MMDREGMSPQERGWWASVEERVVSELLPNLETSAMVVSIAGGEGRPRFEAILETGAAMLLDKPILLIVVPGMMHTVSENLKKVATRIIEADVTSPEGQEIFMQAMREEMALRGEPPHE